MRPTVATVCNSVSALSQCKESTPFLDHAISCNRVPIIFLHCLPELRSGSATWNRGLPHSLP